METDAGHHPRFWNGHVRAAALVGAATAVGFPLHHTLGLADANVLMIYLLSVLWVATHESRAAGIVASLLAVGAFDFFFVPPYFRFTVADPQYLVTFAAMLVTSLVIGTLTHRVRTHAREAKEAWERVEAEFLRNTLLAGVSHELRTPLSAITGAASTLIETGAVRVGEPHGADTRELLETIYAESERMERLITNLLDMTRLESGGLALRREWVPLQEVIGSALHHMDRRLGGREVRVSVAPDLPLAHVDPVALEQVLTNLLDNAIEYTPPDRPIEITAAAADGGPVIEVADRGPGLPKGAEDRVFQKFFRFHPSQAPRGIGLGLTICRGIVEAHGGRIDAANRPGGGAVFRILLPRAGAAPPASAIPAGGIE